MKIPDDVRRRVDEILAERSGHDLRTGPQYSIALIARIPPGEISAREREVVALIAEGLCNREIAARLFVTEETVKSHVRHALRRTQSRNRAHLAVRWALGEIEIWSKELDVRGRT